MPGKFVTAVLAASCFALTATPARACTCMESGPACQAFFKTDAVFDATVRSIEPLDTSRRFPGGAPALADKIIKVDVRQSWKGVDAGPLEITTSGQGGACGFPFKEGGRYLIFAYRTGADGRLHASICSRTQEFDGTGDAADFLASLAAPARGGRVFGTVTTSLRVFDPERPFTKPGTEAPVRLFGGGQERTTLSTGGRYEFSGLTEGAYRVDLQVPDGYTTYSSSRLVQIPGPRACAQENYSLSPAGRITGRLVPKNDNRGLSRIQVDVTDPDARAHPVYGLSVASSSTDAEGYFEVRDLPPGRYIVGVNLKDLPTQYNPYARTVFPSNGSDPEIVTLSLGETVDLGTWEIPPPPAVVKAGGLVTWKDGTPAGGVYVGAWDQTGNPVERARGAGGATSAPDGRFVLDLREGRVYTFMARDKQTALPLVGPRIEVGAAPPPSILLVIQRNPPHVVEKD